MALLPSARVKSLPALSANPGSDPLMLAVSPLSLAPVMIQLLLPETKPLSVSSTSVTTEVP